MGNAIDVVRKRKRQQPGRVRNSGLQGNEEGEKEREKFGLACAPGVTN